MGKKSFRLTIGVAVAVGLAAVVEMSGPGRILAQGTIDIDSDDIGGVVTGPTGPEAGVWVIAETTDLPTKFFRIVVTDDAGRFVLPDLPQAVYEVWVRGYGLVDSEHVNASPGSQLALNAVPAPTPRDAAQYYPPSWWLSLIEVPDDEEFRGEDSGFSSAITNQAEFIGTLKGRCIICHGLGGEATRKVPESIASEFGHGAEAWDVRISSGQRGVTMSSMLTRMGREGFLRVFGDWTERVEAGEFPAVAPLRPAGVERNIVISRWDWNGPKGTVHDSVSTDKRDPTVNAKGRIYGVDLLNGLLPWVDPFENRTGAIEWTVRDPDTPSFANTTVQIPSPYWGEEVIWDSPANMHNPMMDDEGRVWTTSSLRPRSRQPAWCTDASNPFAAYYPLESSGRQTSYYDPDTGEVTLIDTCFGTHHLQFAFDEDDTIYYSGGGNVVGWLKSGVWDADGDAEAAQGWCPAIVDTNGDGTIGEYTEPDEPMDPTKDRRFVGGAYGIIISPLDGAVWWARPATPGYIMRMEVGDNPPATCKTEVYSPPFDPSGGSGVETYAYLPRGLDIDREGLVWTALAGTGALASFDRRKCQVLDGPTATGDHCRDGWTVYETPSGPQFKNMSTPGNAGMHYYNWVDQFNTLGLGSNVPVVNGSNDDALHALVDGSFVTIRSPYPIGGLYTKGLDGRIDDPNTGWKGRGWYTSHNMSLAFHQEGGKGMSGGVYRIQLRPDPLAH